MGKLDLSELENILSINKKAMVKNNGIGWDFSFIKLKNVDIIGKIEPMVYYKFLTPKENAVLSVIFSINDFLTSGITPGLSLIDFESIGQSRDQFIEFISNVLNEINKRRIKLLAAHTGNYGNISEGISGSISFISIRKKPLYSLKKIREDYEVIVVGKLGLEYKFFKEKKYNGKSEIKADDLSIEKIAHCFNNNVYYIHDLSEGGLIRGLYELEYILKHGFSITNEGLEEIKIDELNDEQALEASSSGSAILIVNKKYLENTKCPFLKVNKSSEGIRFKGRKFLSKGDIILELFKNQ